MFVIKKLIIKLYFRTNACKEGRQKISSKPWKDFH